MNKNKTQGLYTISVVSSLVGMHPQTLRLYERLGFIKPSRSKGKIRLYSDEDIEKIKQIQILTQEKGVNLAGVEIIFDMFNQMENISKRIEEKLEEMREEMEEKIKKILESFGQGQGIDV